MFQKRDMMDLYPSKVGFKSGNETYLKNVIIGWKQRLEITVLGVHSLHDPTRRPLLRPARDAAFGRVCDAQRPHPGLRIR